MTTAFQILRSLVSGNRPAGKQYGEPYVNFAENQFGVVDSGGTARDLIGAPIFSTGRSYPINFTVSYQGQLYVALVAVAAGAWNPSQWGLIAPAPASIAWTTGDVKLTIKTIADTGWVMMNDGTIGDASSGGTTRANADCQNLFTLIWNNISQTYCPMQNSAGTVTARGASAAADWAAHSRMPLPKSLGRAFALAGTGSGLTARSLGQFLGEESHTPVLAEVFSHTHGLLTGGSPLAQQQAQNWASQATTDYITNNTGGAGPVSASQGAGSSSPFNVMQPTIFLNVMICL